MTSKPMLVITLAVCSSLAQAQVTVPPCIPGITGKTVPFLPQHRIGATSHHVYWMCVDPTNPTDPTKAVVAGFSFPKESYSPDKFAKALAEITNSKSKVATAKKLYLENFTRDCTPEAAKEQTPFGVMCAERAYLAPKDF